MTVLPPGTTDRVMSQLFQPDYREDPVGWVTERCEEFVWSKQAEILRSIRDNPYTAVKACHGPGKSFIVSRAMGWWVDVWGEDAYVLWTAPRWPQIQAIIGRELRQLHRKVNLPGRITLDMHWYIEVDGQDHEVGMGRKPADHDEHGFQGIHAPRVLIVIDEGCGVPKALIDAAKAIATNPNCRVVILGNPDDEATEFGECFKPGSIWHQISIAVDDTPHWTGEPCPDHVMAQLVDKSWVELRKKDWGEQSGIYRSKVSAEFPEVTEDTLITPTMIRRAQAKELPGMDKGQIGIDVARFGSDESVIYRNRGGQVRLELSKGKQDTMTTAGQAAQILREAGSNTPALIDTIGIGAGVFDRLREQGLPVGEFIAGATPHEPNRFVNRRAEAYWALRELFENDLIDLDPEDSVLAAELMQIKWRPDSSGNRVRIESKDEIRRRLKRSPDRADAVMMSCYTLGLDLDPETLQEQPDYGMTGDLLTKAW